MFSIYLLDNPQLYQWDLNRKIKIIGKEENIDEIHICHIGDEEALVVPIKKEKNILIADIPNILLQTSEEIMIYLVKNNKTIKEFFFKVNNRERPSAYVYEETEVLNYSLLNKRLNQLEEDLDNIVIDNIELPKPDWAESNANSINYIANRTHYESENTYFTFNDFQEEPIGIFCALDLSEWTSTSSLKYYMGYEEMIDYDYDYRFEIIHTSRLIKNGKLYENYSTNVMDTNTFLIDSDNYYITGNKINFNIYVILNPSILTDEYKNKFSKRGVYIETYQLDGKYTMELLKMKIRSKFFKALDRRFIPAKIARQSAVDELSTDISKKITSPTIATVGQLLSVKSVDENGKPTEWEVVDKPEGVTTTADDKGKVVTVDSEGNKILEYPSMISYKYADKIQESNTQVLFCFDTAKPNLGLFSMPNKITTFRVYKDGVYIQGADLKTYNPFIELNVIDCNETRIFVIGKLASGKVVCYFYYFSSNKWSVETQMLPLESLENMFIQAPDKAEVGQILSVKDVDEDGKPIEWEVIDRVQPDMSQKKSDAVDYVKNKLVYDCPLSVAAGDSEYYECNIIETPVYGITTIKDLSSVPSSVLKIYTYDYNCNINSNPYMKISYTMKSNGANASVGFSKTSSLYTAIDTVNAKISIPNATHGVHIYLITDISVLADEYKELFTYPGVYLQVTNEKYDGEFAAIYNIKVQFHKVFPLSKRYIDSNLIKDVDSKITSPTTATVGQLLSVKTVDENNKPTEWEAIDAPTGSGGDGYSPIATVEQTETGATISIQDKNGTTTAVVNHGADGKDGKDGYTPQKGIDYFDGKDGLNGKDGADGKTAYQYAKDGGYTGTEEKFAQKMAKELPTKLSDLENDSSFVKNNDYASAATAGVMKVNIGPGSGLDLENGEKLKLVGAGQKSITEKYGDAPITPSNLDYAVRAGLSANRLEWTESQKQSARDLIGASDSGIEITDGEPTKESTVMTLNPNAEEVNLYTAEEIDAKFDAFINAEEVAY